MRFANCFRCVYFIICAVWSFFCVFVVVTFYSSCLYGSIEEVDWLGKKKITLKVDV